VQKGSMSKYCISEECIFVEKFTDGERPILSYCIEKIQDSDILYVWRLDKLGRTLKELSLACDTLKKKGVRLFSISENIDSVEMLSFFEIINIFCQFEKNSAQERTKFAIREARKHGTVIGRRKKLTQEEVINVVTMYCADVPIKNILATYNIAKSCLYSYLRRSKIPLKKSQKAE
jgi:DNA invertase Pin-like site-specific DNA recombinase